MLKNAVAIAAFRFWLLLWFATSRGFVGSQEFVDEDESAGVTKRGLLEDEELGKMAVRV